MYQDGLVGREKRCRLLQAATCLQQQLRLVAQLHQRGIVGRRNMVGYLLGEMMDIDHEMLIALLHQPRHDNIEQRLSPHGYQSLRHGIGKRLQACAQPCGENHGLLHGVGDW